jgi:penicillin-binding protein 1C
VVLDSEGGVLRGFTSSDDKWRLVTHPDGVDPLYLRMLLAYEDRRFWIHPGVDPLALIRALGQFVAEGRVISGASTLTMQTARLLEPRPRTFGAKIVEILRAFQLELHLSKEEILEIYLTLVPFGGNLEGVRAASLAYFGKEPTHLTPGEAALLVVLPQAPARFGPNRFPQEALAARDKVLVRMRDVGVLTQAKLQEAREEAIPTELHDRPFSAPHLGDRLRASRPDLSLHRTHIVGALQRELEALARSHKAVLDDHASIAILAVENSSRKVIGYVGSADFFDRARFGEIDMVRAVRSPGSALKPFIYGMGFDDMIIHPETMVNDVPMRFGDYEPTNFSKTHHGEVTVRQALQQSLNIPAVAVLDRVGPSRFAATLQEAGIVLHFGEFHDKPSLPIALGGVGITLEDLVTLYAGIARGGLVAPLALTEEDKPRPEKQVTSPVAAWYLARILEDSPLPESFVSASKMKKQRRIAHKTGTSYGFRDAWAIGYTSDYTIGVWVGRPDGTPSPDKYGRNTAAPLMFKAFDLLPEPKEIVLVPPDGVIMADNADLPPSLRFFVSRGQSWKGAFIEVGRELQITFPVDGSTLEMSRNGGYRDKLLLIASGGVKPIRWLVNGAPISSSPTKREAFWTPDGEGAVHITAIDANGVAVTSEVTLKRYKED